MSCGQCNLHKNSFKTEKEFSCFEGLIASMVKSGQLSEQGRVRGTNFFQVKYKCNSCNAIWLLSFPDQSYRGGWHEE